MASDTTIDGREIDRFAALATRWWDETGPMAALHRINPLRLRFLRDTLAAAFARDPARLDPLAGLTLLDIGCGAGLVAEPMARLGAMVTAIDGSPDVIAAARRHAGELGLAIRYRAAPAETLVDEGGRFDVVLALEIVEHVADVAQFLRLCGALINPDGAIVMSTLNRTARSLTFGKLAAEYALGWVPRGTHSWRKFVKPAELARGLRDGGVSVTDLVGMRYDALRARWALSRDVSINYFMVGRKRH